MNRLLFFGFFFALSLLFFFFSFRYCQFVVTCNRHLHKNIMQWNGSNNFCRKKGRNSVWVACIILLANLDQTTEQKERKKIKETRHESPTKIYQPKQDNTHLRARLHTHTNIASMFGILCALTTCILLYHYLLIITTAIIVVRIHSYRLISKVRFSIHHLCS